MLDYATRDETSAKELTNGVDAVREGAKVDREMFEIGGAVGGLVSVGDVTFVKLGDEGF